MTCIAPDPVDVIDFQFKAHCRLKIFNKDANNTIKTNCNLLAVAYRFGLIFVGTPNNELQVIQFKDIEAFSKDVSSYKRRVVKLESAPYFVSINCDCTKLALVCTAKDGCPIAKVYDVSSFLRTNVQELKTIRLSSSADCNIVSCDWNPALPDIFTACNSDGSLGVYEFKGSAMEYNQLPAASGAKCFCWSPKGKQIAVGSLDGKITQYKPDLKAVKAVPPPPEYTTITDLCWLSSFQFIGVYKNSEGTHSIVCVDAPKAGPVTYTCHEDICYSNGTVRPQQFYLIHQMHWNVIMVASSNGMELGVLGMTGDKWTQWILNDNSRAELPLNSSKDDTLPIGVTFSVGASKCVIGDETKHVPLLILLSDDGVLCTFFTINSRSGAADICTPLENLPDRSGEQLYIVGSAESSQPSVVSQAVVAPHTVSSKPQQIMVTPTKAPGLFETKPQGLFQPAIPPPGFGQTSGMFSAKPFVSPIPQSQPQPQTQSVSAFQTSTPFVPKPQTLAPIRPVAVPSSVPLLPDAVTVTTTPPRQPPPPTIEPAAAPTQPYIPKVPVPKSAEKLDDTKHETFARKLPVNEETEAIIGKLVKDECLTLEGEINSIIARGNATSLTFGSDPQFKEMAKQAADLEEFYQAIKENINTLDNEVYTLKQALMHTWGCYEEARTRFEGSKDPCAKALLQSLPLDPASKYQLEEINRMMYYLETQLNEANRCLDEQWDTFQDALMKSNKLKLPTMESIYQTMVQHSKTFQKQRYLLKNIANRIKSSQLNTVLNSANTEKSSFVSLEHELSLLHINPKSGVVSDYNRIIERQSKVNENKVSRLRALLLNRGVSHVSITKPNLNNSTIQLSTLLAAPLSPIATESRNNTQLSTMKPSTAFGTIQQSDSRIGVAPLTSRPALLATPVCTVSDRFSTIDGNVKATTWATAKPSPFMAVTTHAEPTRPVALNINNESIATTTVIPISTNSWMQNTYTSGKPTVFTTTTATTPITTPVNIFRQNSASQPASSALFAPDLPTTSSGPLFSAKIVKPTPSMFTVPSKPIFGTTSETPTSVFTFSTGVAATTTPSSFSTLNKASSLRGNGTSHAATNPSIFGISSTAKPVLQPVSSNKPALFGSTTITSPTSASSMGGMFGSLRTSNVGVTPATTSSIFGTSASAKTMPSTTLQVGTVIGTATGTSAQSVFAPATSKGTIIPATISTATSVFGFVTTAVDTAFGTVTSVTSTPQILASNTSKAPGVISTTTSTSAAPVTQSSFGSVTSTKLLQEPLSVSGSVSTTPKSTVGSTSVLAPGLISSASNSGIGSTTSVFASLPVGGTTCATTSPFVQSSVSTPSIFSQSTTTTSLGQVSTTANIFGQASTKSIFSQPVTTNSGIFGQPVSAVVTPFAQVTTTTANIFGQAITSATTTATSIFGKTAPTAATFPQTGTTATSPFTQTVTTVASPFAQTATTVGSPFAQTATTSASPFAQTGSTAATPFGQTATSGTSPFGQSATSSASLFGKPATSASGIFGQAAPPTGIFGQTASTTSTPFGQTNSSTFSSSGSLFGQPATFGSGSIFGGTAAPSAFGSAPVFGTTTSAQSSPFGSSSPFGTTATTSASVFSSPQNQTSFGNAFGGGSTFGAQSQGSIFGGTAASTTSGTFNTFSSLSVGATPKPAFGQPSTSVPNPFSRPADQKTNFGNPGNLFASPVSSAASIFGGSPSNTQTFGNSPFGNSSFGQQQSAFGNTSFGSPTPAGAFSAGTQSVQQSGFGSPSFQKPAFGSGPVFGQPAFGGSASFGGSPSFGGTPTFGSPQKVFGTGAEPTAFGTASTGNATFGSLANQNTVGFGNLAQQASQPAQPLPFSGGSSFTNWRN